MKNYFLAFVLEGTGEFEVIEVFESPDDESANKYAEGKYANYDWYVLDETGQNINAVC